MFLKTGVYTLDGVTARRWRQPLMVGDWRNLAPASRLRRQFAGDQSMKIILYILGFFALIGILLVAGCFKLVF